MIDIRTFLERVVPWPEPEEAAWVNMHTGPHFGGIAVQSVDAFLREVEGIRGRDIYICLSKQRLSKPNGTKMLAKRHQVDALLLTSVFFDIDVGEAKAANKQGYATTIAAAAALKAFLAAAKLPRPSAVVASGSGGFHVYFWSDRPLIPGVWQTYANALQALADRHGFLIDPAVTRDSARVLRVPGTLNFKWNPPKPVELLPVGSGETYDFSAVFASTAVTAAGASAPGRAGPTLPTRFQGRTVEKIIVELPDAPLADPKTVIPLCPFLANTLRTGGDNRPEPQWYQAIRCATYMENGQKLAHAFSSADSRYSEGGTDAKWNYALDHKEALGWPSCSGIAGSGAPECKTCPHRAKGLSPFKLQREIAKVAPRALAKKEIKDWRETLPYGFSYDEKRQTIMMDIVNEDDEDDNDNRTATTEVFQTRIVGQPWVNDIGLNLEVKLDDEKFRDVLIPFVDFTRGRVYARLFTEKIMRGNAMTPAKMEAFLASWVEKMNSYVLIKTQGAFGWREKEGSILPVGFSFGGMLFKNDGTAERSPIGSAKLQAEFTPCGTEEAWHKAADLILKQNKPELEIVLAAAFAGPLMRILGEDGAHLAVWSSSTGAHKSTASKIAAAVWGDPRKTRQTKGSSWKGAVKHLEDTVNLTAYWDDIQDDNEMKRLVDTALQLCQGSAGMKLMQNRDYYPTGDWQTLCVSCSNMSVVDWLAKKEGSTDFRIARVFEVMHIKTLGEGVVKNLDAMQTIGELNRNYGRIGMKYAELLANNVQEIFDLVKSEEAAFTKEVIAKTGIKEDTANRYWLCACITTIVGAQLAKEMGIDFHLDALRKRLVEAFVENINRKSEEQADGGSDANTQNVIIRFLKAAGAGNAQWTKGSAKQGGSGQVVELNTTPREAHQELWVQAVTDQREIRISRAAFMAWAAEFNVSYSATKSGLQKHYGVSKKRRELILGSGTSWQRGKEDAIVIPVPEGSPFETFLFAHGSAEKIK